MDKVIIIDFGSQYTQLIARRVRELNIYSEIYSYENFPEITEDIKAVILSGSPNSVHSSQPFLMDIKKLIGKIPVLAICYGSQLIAHLLGGKVSAASVREYGRANLKFSENDLFVEVEIDSEIWMSHADTIIELPDNFKIIATTNDIPVAAFEILNCKVYGLQFHPEVSHSKDGKKILSNFLIKICLIKPSWTPENFVNETIAKLKSTIKNSKVLLAISGGVDSTVAAAILHKAIGKNLFCIFVDNGLLRKNEFEQVLSSYTEMGLNIRGIDAKKLFYKNLENITDPELKRKAIGKTFIDVFEEASKTIDGVEFLAQGTIYPDVVESFGKHSASIKSHHNVGGLPEKMNLKIVEPLRLLFKDEVRNVGKYLFVPEQILLRHPFPGPGLGIRILGNVTEQKIKILQDVDEIFIDGLKRENLYNSVWQAGSILLPVQSVGVMGDERTYENCIALRAVESLDGMTADWVHLPYQFLSKISNEIINRVKGINRVVYDISSKPPATIEWE